MMVSYIISFMMFQFLRPSTAFQDISYNFRYVYLHINIIIFCSPYNFMDENDDDERWQRKKFNQYALVRHVQARHMVYTF